MTIEVVSVEPMTVEITVGEIVVDSSVVNHGAKHISTGTDPIPLGTESAAGVLQLASTGVPAAMKAVKALGADLVALITAAGYTLNPATGTASLDGIADGTTYKRVLAAIATALNASTVVAGTQWGSGNDGNGGQPPAPKPALGAPAGGANGPGQFIPISQYSAYTAPGLGSAYWMGIIICHTTATGAIVTANSGAGIWAGGTVFTCAVGQTIQGFIWRQL